jgi:hypothetical protein
MYCEEDNGGIAVLVDGEGTLKQTEQERYLEGGRVVKCEGDPGVSIS